ncbi:hypothetical protein CPB84DRAFT_1857268 [Gymnopilus junonius]|uniref:Uncharacterized protein n=1 Tax=Gymnopilus junonius TaxID=109634 RepID=A0A9P5N7Q9_GYMJU|nr:hypothetical protein CPB84DRAFT_1857268 [Gymnopilus junonius]
MSSGIPTALSLAKIILSKLSHQPKPTSPSKFNLVANSAWRTLQNIVYKVTIAKALDLLDKGKKPAASNLNQENEGMIGTPPMDKSPSSSSLLSLLDSSIESSDLELESEFSDKTIGIAKDPASTVKPISIFRNIETMNQYPLLNEALHTSVLKYCPFPTNSLAGDNPSMEELIEIPAHFQLDLLLDPKLLISEFLKYPFLPQTKDASMTAIQFWSEQDPDILEDEIAVQLKELSIPPPNLLSELEHVNKNAKLVVFTHLQMVNKHFPLWVTHYWLKVSQIRWYTRWPWVKAENWLNKHEGSYRLSDQCHFCKVTQCLLLSIPWASCIVGFSNPELTVSLVIYLSNSWLMMTHIDQQLEQLQCQLSHEVIASTCIVIGP